MLRQKPRWDRFSERGLALAEALYRRPRWWDVALYSVGVIGAVVVSHSSYNLHAAWARIAVCGYAAGLALSLVVRRRARAAVLVMVSVVTIAAPLATQVTERAQSSDRWQYAQAEVAVVERSARVWVDAGSPYARPGERGVPQDGTFATHPDLAYDPYFPGMSAFGLPALLVGGKPAIADARLWFAIVSALCLMAAAWLRRGAGGMAFVGWQALLVVPPIALEAAVGGDDLPVAAAMVLSLALAGRRRPALAGAVTGLAMAAKATAWPLLPLLWWALRRRHAERESNVFVLMALAVALPILVAGILPAPGDAFFELVRFPFGLTSMRSPAVSPLPGFLLSNSFRYGRALTGVLLVGVVVAAVVVWRRRPPRSVASVGWHYSVFMTAVIILAPQPRYGYFDYPIVMIAMTLPARLPRRAPPALREEASPEPRYVA